MFIPDGYPGLRVAQTPHLDLGAQRFPAAADRKLPAPRDQRQIHQDQICNPVADADAAVRVLRQPAAVHQGALPPLPRKQHPRPLGFLRGADANLLPAEIRTGCGIVRSCRRRNPALTFPLNPPLTKGDFYKPGYQCKSTSGRNKDSCGIARSCRRKNPALIFPLSPPLTKGDFSYTGVPMQICFRQK